MLGRVRKDKGEDSAMTTSAVEVLTMWVRKLTSAKESRGIHC